MKKGVYMMWAVLAVSGLLSVPVQAQHKEFLLDYGCAVGGAKMEQGDVANYSRIFKSDQFYIILAHGGKNALDIDLRILASNGDVLAEDFGEGSHAIVAFRPDTSGEYNIQIILAEAAKPEICFFEVRTVGRGLNAPDDLLEHVVENLLPKSGYLNLGGYDELPVRVFGVVLEENSQSWGIEFSGLPGSNYAAVVLTDSSVIKPSLSVSQNNREISKDDLADGFLFCEFWTLSNFNLELSFKRTTTPGLMIVVLYEKLPS